MAKTISDAVLVACLEAAARVAASWASTPNAGGSDARDVFKAVLDEAVSKAQKS